MAPKLTLGEYAKKLRATAREAPRFADSMVRDTARTIAYTLILETPVDTGRAASNWQAGIDDIPRFYRHRQISGRRLRPSSPQAGINEAMKQTYATIARYNGEGIIYITNNAPYVLYLNTTRPSPQAPPGWIEAAIANAKEAIRSHKKGFSTLGVGIERLGEGKVIETVVRPRNIGITPIAVKPPTSATSRRRTRG